MITSAARTHCKGAKHFKLGCRQQKWRERRRTKKLRNSLFSENINTKFGSKLFYLKLSHLLNFPSLSHPLPRIPYSSSSSSSVTFFCVQWISGTESRIINSLVPKRPGKNISQIKDKNKKYLKQNMKQYIFKKIS